jgi:putative flippase GtrA
MPDAAFARRSRPPGSPLRHYCGFLLAGALALITDGALLVIQTRTMGLDPLLARPFAIAVAMVVSWLINRTVTFAVAAPPTLREFARFAAVSWTAQVVNYLLFATVLVIRPATPALFALVLASLVAMFISYFGFRYRVFQKGTGAPWRIDASSRPAARARESP